MKARFENLKSQVENLTIAELQNEVRSLASVIVNTDERLISVSKKFTSYGTWKSVGFANEYHFGAELAALIEKAMSGRISHDEDKEFEVKGFEYDIFDMIFENI